MLKRFTDHHSVVTYLNSNNCSTRWSSFAQGRNEQYGLHFCLLCSLQPGKLHISEELLSSCGHDLTADVPPKLCSLFVERGHGTLHQDISVVAHKAPSSYISISRLHGTCIPTLSDSSCLCCSSKPPSRDFERSTKLEASLFFWNCQTFIVPRQSRGFT